MKNKMLIAVSLFMLVLLTFCTKPCEKCPPVEVTREVEVTRIVTVEVPVTVTAPSGIEGEGAPPLPFIIDRENIPSNTLDIFYSTRSYDMGESNPDPYMANELILLGSKERLNDLLMEFSDFRTISSDSRANGDEFRLIRTGKLSAEDALTAIDEASFNDISVGKNYLTAAPWDVEASPWDVEASLEGKLVNGSFLLKFGEDEYHNLPWMHWAFQKGNLEEIPRDRENLIDPWGINLFLTPTPSVQSDEVAEGDIKLIEGVRTISEMGEGIKVYIFDTSPLPPGTMIPFGFSNEITVRVADTIIPDADLLDTDRRANTNEHGLFVAGLVHIVAPMADIELVKILNNQGVGEIYTLTNELERLLEEYGADSDPRTKKLNNVVINLSLGFHSVPLMSSEDIGFNTDPIVGELHRQLRKVWEEGAVIIAAAGNHASLLDTANSWPGLKSIPHMPEKSFDFLNQVPSMHSAYPAAWSEIISVSGYGGDTAKMSCFSNEIPAGQRGMFSNISSPSGGGYQIGSSTNSEHELPVVLVCQSPQEGCMNQDDYSCPYTIVSMTTNGYAHWTGTSFGTPIVSGIVALLLEKCNQEGNLNSAAIQNYIVRKYYQDEPDRLDIVDILTDCPSN